MATSMAPVGMAVGQDLPAFLKASRPQARQGFARLPDRGDLMGYPTRRVVRADGAYTWYRADLSEAHALKAVADGRMRVTMPDGSAVDFRYERHVEHPSGDWTWVGHAVAGRTSDEIVVTFGDKAAFGTIARPGRTPLNLVMRDGASWLVEADPAKVAQIVNPATRPTAPDFLLPPPMAAARGLAGTAASAPVAAAAAANASTTVDVVLGYTPGFASSVGGQSQAVTRLNFLVDVTNEAYVNSQVDARVRLVHTLQVDYPDATDNGDALEALTGYRSGTGTIPVPAALQPLRNARDQYGGDLVSLVRKFNTPENDGCGIAWLIGGGRTTIDGNDAPFGYSVVSDGQDAGTDGKTYFCRQETLGHEMGHNMGLQHDRNTADGDDNVLQNNEYGAFSYSFGHKTAAGAGNFYTVMAYGDTGQTPYRVFSNPRITTCGGFACGVADVADNARALGQTMSLIGSFRASLRRPVNDVDADGVADLLWLNGQNLSFWRMQGGQVVATGGQRVSQAYIHIGSGDIDGNGFADFVWRDGEFLRLWLNNGAGGFLDAYLNTYPRGWTLVGSDDINGDGRDDLIWQKGAAVSFWLMNGSSITPASPASPLASPAIPMSVGDFNGDGRADIIWRNAAEDMFAWVSTPSSNSLTFTSQSLGKMPRGWSLRFASDFNGDGTADLAWYNGSALSWWLVAPGNGGAIAVSAIGGRTLPGGSTLLDVNDFTGDGLADVAFRAADGGIQLYASAISAPTALSVSTYPSGWLVGGRRDPYTWRSGLVRDVDGDNISDVAWFKTGVLSYWKMYGSTVVSTGGASVASGRSVIAHGDFDGDLVEDVILRNADALILGRRAGTQSGEEVFATFPAGWTLAGAPDIDGDGRADLLWQQGAVFSYWLMDGPTIRAVSGQSLPAAYTFLGASDVDADGRADIVWRFSDQLYVSRSYGGTFNTFAIGGYPAGWTLLAIGDVDGDQGGDLMWHNGAGVFSHWKLRNIQASPQEGQQMAITGQVVASGDYDGDGKADLMWRNAAGELILAIPDGNATRPARTYPVSQYPTGWALVF